MRYSEKRFAANGTTYQLGELAEMYGVKYQTLYARVQANSGINGVIAKPGTKWHSKKFREKQAQRKANPPTRQPRNSAISPTIAMT